MATGTALMAFYDYRLIALSIVIAIFAAYAALDLAGRVTVARGRIRFAWLSGGAVAMGLGIWSMHYVGMQALRLPVPVKYDWPTVLLSIVAAVLASAIALFVVSRQTMGVAVAIAGSILMGSGIAAMHYIGMAAMRLPAMCSYSPRLVALSVAFAIVASFAAIELTFGVRAQTASFRKSVSALAMGLAIAGMHYIGMSAASFRPAPMPTSELTHAIDISAIGVAGIGLVTLLLLAMVLLASILDRLVELQAETQKDSHKRAEELASIVDYSDDAIIGKSLDGTILSWNKGAERLYGYLGGEVLGKPISILLPPDRADELAEIIAKLSRGGIVNEETVRLRKDGTLLEVALTVSPIKNSRGQVVAISSIARDISERKRAEAEIFHNSAKLESSNRQLQDTNAQLERAKVDAEAANLAKSTFLSTMSHEIRTPMNAILGYTQLMLRDPKLGTEAKTNLRIMSRSGEHLLSLINDVLDMSKIEAGRAQINPATFSLSRLLGDLTSMFRFRTEAKGLRFEVLTHGEGVPYLVADEGKIRQALINLLGNAIKFTRSGQVALHVSLEQKSMNQLWLSARVEDTGPGISDEDQAKLFAPFCQVKDALNTKGGTGLGLAITRRFARLMGGDVTVSSGVGRGSVFLFEVPVDRGDAGAAAKRSPSRRVIGMASRVGGPKILIVDDLFENRDWLAKLLTSIGFSVRSADNGEGAIRTWEEWEPQLILMDVHMPVLDGLEATRRIKANPRGKETVIVALTASTLDAEREATSQSGANDFLSKPCLEDELLEKIGNHLNIEYEYEETGRDDEDRVQADGEALSAERLGLLPLELLNKLRTAILGGNKRALDHMIPEIGETVDVGIAQGLQGLASNFEYDALLSLLDAACRR